MTDRVALYVDIWRLRGHTLSSKFVAVIGRVKENSVWSDYFFNSSARRSHDWFAPRGDSALHEEVYTEKSHTTDDIFQLIVGWGWYRP